MRNGLTRWVLVVTLGLAAVAVGQERLARCKKACDVNEKECVDSCKKLMKKKAPANESYCAPKCAEMKPACEKECDRAYKKRSQ